MPPKKKLRQTELTFFKKAEKTDTGTIALTYLLTYKPTALITSLLSGNCLSVCL